jgi:hypothetical protein
LKIRAAGFAGWSNRSQVNVFSFGVGTFDQEFDFLGVEGEHFFEFVSVRQSQVHALIAYAGLRQLEQPLPPDLVPADQLKNFVEVIRMV